MKYKRQGRYRDGYAAFLARTAKLDAEERAARQQEIALARAQIDALMREHGLTLQDLLAEPRGGRHNAFVHRPMTDGA